MQEKPEKELIDLWGGSQEKDNEVSQRSNQTIEMVNLIKLPYNISESTLSQDFSKIAIQQKQRYKLHPLILEDTPITENMRARLRSFLMAESQKQCLLRETTTLACTYIDLYFLNKGRVEVQQFQNMAISCLILATKIKEGKFPTINFQTFNRQQLLSYEKKIAKKLNYYLNPPTYHTFAQRVVYLWDLFIQHQGSYNVHFSECPGKVNFQLRTYLQQLDYVYFTLKSLSYSIQEVTLNLFYIHSRLFYTKNAPDPTKMDKKQFMRVFYSKKDPFKCYFQKFMFSCSQNYKQLNYSMAGFLKIFLGIEPTKKQWSFKQNPAINKIFSWDKLQTSSKEDYNIFKLLLVKINIDEKKK